MAQAGIGARAGQPVWVRHESAAVWHLTRWAADGRSLERPLCGESAMFPPAWLRWMGTDSPALTDQCRLCRSLAAAGLRVSA